MTVEQFTEIITGEFDEDGMIFYTTIADNLDIIFENFSRWPELLEKDVLDELVKRLEMPNMTYSRKVQEYFNKQQRSILEEVSHKPENAPAGKSVVCDNGNARSSKEFKPIKAVTAAELDNMDIPPIDWIVEKILPVGLSMIGAPSKYYKSYMALGMCVAICNGGKFLGFDCNKNGCLYLDLESTKRRPKNRLDQILGTSGHKPDNLYIITGTDEPGRIGEGFEAQIEYQLREHPDIKLVVVDVFQMIRQPAKRNQTGYNRDYKDFRALKQIADKHSIGIMLIHHTRKMKDPSDVFNELSGSVGVMGALDCAWVITKDDRYSMEGTLHITGRDMESQKLKIRFDKKSFQWEYVGTEEDIEAQRLQFEYDQSPIVETIKKLIKQHNGHWEGSASEIQGASKYYGCQIYDDVRKVGSLINKYEGLLWSVDGIVFEYDTKTRGKRKYIFNVVDVANDGNASHVDDVEIEQQELSFATSAT